MNIKDKHKNLIDRAFKAFHSLETMQNLRRNELTLSDHRPLYSHLYHLKTEGVAATDRKTIAKWLKRQGFRVKKDYIRELYIITP